MPRIPSIPRAEDRWGGWGLEDRWGLYDVFHGSITERHTARDNGLVSFAMWRTWLAGVATCFACMSAYGIQVYTFYISYILLHTVHQIHNVRICDVCDVCDVTVEPGRAVEDGWGGRGGSRREIVRKVLMWKSEIFAEFCDLLRVLWSEVTENETFDT